VERSEAKNPEVASILDSSFQGNDKSIFFLLLKQAYSWNDSFLKRINDVFIKE
jgi:hypothetical protein